MAILDRKV
jgi:hypothetical protein